MLGLRREFADRHVSIMRRRNGLIVSSVMGDAPVLSEVVDNPSSQYRTSRPAILFAVPPAATNYRASGLVHWHYAGTTIADVAKAAGLSSGIVNFSDLRRCPLSHRRWRNS